MIRHLFVVKYMWRKQKERIALDARTRAAITLHPLRRYDLRGLVSPVYEHHIIKSEGARNNEQESRKGDARHRKG